MSINEVEHNERNASGGRSRTGQGITELVRILGTRQKVNVAGDLLERSNLLFGAVFQHGEVFLLQPGDVIARFVGDDVWGSAPVRCAR